MANRPKFRRRLRQRDDSDAGDGDDLRPVPPLERPADRRAREAESAAEAQRAAEAEAEARRVAEARRAAEARQAAEARRAAEEKRAAEARRAAEAEAEARARAEARHRSELETAEALGPQDHADAARLAEVARHREAAEARRRAVAARRAETEAAASAAPRVHRPEPEDSDRLWERMACFPVDENRLDRRRVVSASRHDPAHIPFDVLRTRLLQALSERQWSRIAVTSPTKGCGKTFTAANLGISLSRQQKCRTVVLDLDMRSPSLHTIFGVEKPGSIGDMLRGTVAPETHLKRLGPNTFHAGRSIAFGFNDVVEPYAAELLQDPRAARALDDLEARLEPDVMLFDLPPALAADDVLALRPHFDAVLLVVGGGMSNKTEIDEVRERLGERTPLLGVILNRAEGINPQRYAY